MPSEKIHKFETEGVTITIPSLARKIAVRKAAPGNLKDMPQTDADFVPRRVVIDFDFYDEDAPQASLTSIDAAFELRVRYTQQDVANAGGDWHSLKLAFYRGGKWKRFTQEKHHFILHPDEADPNTGYGVVQIRDWSDPNIGWGQ